MLTDYYIGCNGTGITVTLPLGATVPIGKVYVIKDESGLATSNPAYRFTLLHDRRRPERPNYYRLLGHHSSMDWKFVVNYLISESSRDDLYASHNCKRLSEELDDPGSRGMRLPWVLQSFGSRTCRSGGSGSTWSLVRPIF